MTDAPQLDQTRGEPARYALSSAVYVRRGGKILLLKRATGAATGSWYIPGGAVEAGETAEEAARRELFEEAGLTPSGPLHLIGTYPMFVYGTDMLQVTFACDCEEGDVKLSVEHSAVRWLTPAEYRQRYLGDELLASIRDEALASMVRYIRDDLDRFIAWQDHDFLDHQLRVLRLTAEMYVVRDGKILLLRRNGGLGDGFWYVPGGVVEPGEEPHAAAVRETLEESGLAVERPRLLRVWSYPAQNGLDAFHATYIAESPAGDVALSTEHTAFRWMPAADYAEKYCGEAVEAAEPQWAAFFAQVRTNCSLVASVASN